MAVAKLQAEFSCDVKKIWDTVTSLEDYAWRSDLSRIEALEEGKTFVEYTKDGFSTTFTITRFEPPRFYAFDMENENMKGRWTGKIFCRDGKACIDFTEDVTAKKLFMKPFVKSFLKKQQKRYHRDLRQALEGGV